MDKSVLAALRHALSSGVRMPWKDAPIQSGQWLAMTVWWVNSMGLSSVLSRFVIKNMPDFPVSF